MALVAVAGCGSQLPQPRLQDLESPDVTERVRAIKWAGENQMEAAVPLLVDRLAEQDPAVRFFAIQSLERITGETLGYRYLAPPAARAQAVARWRETLASGRWRNGGGEGTQQ
jgi:hypothetical protein